VTRTRRETRLLNLFLLLTVNQATNSHTMAQDENTGVELSPKKKGELIGAIKAGLNPHAASGVVGIKSSTAYYVTTETIDLG